MGNPFGRSTIVPLTNKSGGSVAAGDVVVVDTTNNDAFTTSTAGAFTGGIGIAQQTIASNATGLVLIGGYAALVNVNASVTRGHFGKTYTVVKQATDAGASRVAGTFCVFLTGGTTPDAIIWQPDLGAGSSLFPTVSQASVLTDENLTGNNSWVDLSTAGPAVTITVNTAIRLSLSGHIYFASNATYGGMGFAASSGNTIAAAAAKCIQVGFGINTTAADLRLSQAWVITGLTPGSTVFTAKYNQFGGGGVTHWTDRYLSVELLD